MLEKQKPQKEKHGIGFTKDIASTSNTKTKKLSPIVDQKSTVEPALLVPSAREPDSSIEQNRLSAENVGNLESNDTAQQEDMDFDETYAPGLWYPKGTGIETIVYADFDHAGDYVHRKSTSGVCTFMGCCLTSWFSKKQIALAISTTEAEYISAEKAFQQALWMKQALVDYDIVLDDIPVLCDNKGAIDLSKNPVLHSRTKHIQICHHL
ncbi:hypothetical protein Tco_0120791 [Tanacetum coccineum]